MEISPSDRRGLGNGFPRLLDRAVAASSSGIVITDPTQPDEPIIYVNPAFERMTGYSAGEVIGCNCRFLQGSDHDQADLQKLREAIREGRECQVVLRNYRKSGEQFFNELHVSPVRDDSAALIGFVGVQNDITERKRAEEERERLLSREQAARLVAVDARKRLSLLAAAGPMLSSLDYSETLQKITALFVPELADWCLVDTLGDDGALRQSTEAHADPTKARSLAGLRERRVFEPASQMVRNTMDLRDPEIPEDTGGVLADEFPGDSLKDLETGSCLRVPLMAREHSLGVITLFSSEEGRYGEEDAVLAGSLANRCALALDNARLYGEREYIARTLQRSLLPRLPETRGVEAGAVYRPVGEENEVGGDFYDLVPASRNPADDQNPGGEGWIALVGDVCGKGVLAATTTALLRYTARAVAVRERNPSAILSALNESMLRDTPAHHFCTAACILMEPAGDGLNLTLARGGHSPPILLRGDGSAEKLGPPGKAIGIFPDPDLFEQSARLEAGDAVVLYTDGVTEARSPGGDFFGEERLLSLLRSCAGLRASTIADRALDAVMEHSREEPGDDVTVFVLRVPDTGGFATRSGESRSS